MILKYHNCSESIFKQMPFIKRIIIVLIILNVSLNAENDTKWNDPSVIIINDNITFNNDNIKSPHNLSISNTHIDEGDNQCMFCHEPTKKKKNTLLWDNSIKSNSIKPNIKNHLVTSKASLKCLGCHDGVTGKNNLPNGTIGFSYASLDVTQNIYSSGDLANTTSNYLLDQLGGDNHPVGIVYDETKEGFNSIADLKLAKLEAGTNKVTCATCHEPHGTTNGSFLTISNVGSSLCLDCHNK